MHHPPHLDIDIDKLITDENDPKFRVLLMLQYDNFLIEGEGFNWRFSLNLIRQWWRGQRGMA